MANSPKSDLKLCGKGQALVARGGGGGGVSSVDYWGNMRVEWIASTLHTTSEHGVASITTADAHSSAAGSRLN